MNLHKVTAALKPRASFSVFSIYPRVNVLMFQLEKTSLLLNSFSERD